MRIVQANFARPREHAAIQFSGVTCPFVKKAANLLLSALGRQLREVYSALTATAS